MNIIKFCFIAPFVFLCPTDSAPVAQAPIKPSHVLHIRKDLPGIISFGPIFITTVKRGIFTDNVSVLPGNGLPDGLSDNFVALVPCKGKLGSPGIVEVEEPLEVIQVGQTAPGQPDEEGGEINDLLSEYNDFSNKSELTSDQIHSIQMSELDRIREEELDQEFEILNQVKEVPDEFEREEEEEPSSVQSNDYEYTAYTDPELNAPREPEIESEAQENQFEIGRYGNNPSEPEPKVPEPEEYDHSSESQEYEKDATAPRQLPSGINERMKLSSMGHSREPREPSQSTFQSTLQSTPEEIQKEVQEPEIAEDISTWSTRTSPEVAHSVNEYIDSYKPRENYPCPPKDSTQVSERHENLIKSSLTRERKRINNVFNGVRAYAARYDDTRNFM